MENVILRVILLLILLFVTLCLWNYQKLRHLNGPLLASLSNIPRAGWVWSNRAHKIHVGLHKKYGKIVRFGPNMVSVQDPAEISKIYDYAGTFPKVRDEAINVRCGRELIKDVSDSQISTTFCSSTQGAGRCQPFSPLRTRLCIAHFANR